MYPYNVLFTFSYRSVTFIQWWNCSVPVPCDGHILCDLLLWIGSFDARYADVHKWDVISGLLSRMWCKLRCLQIFTCGCRSENVYRSRDGCTLKWILLRHETITTHVGLVELRYCWKHVHMYYRCIGCNWKYVMS